MRITISLFVFTFLCGGMLAQAPYPTRDEAMRFNKTRTMVVLEDELFSGFNIYIKSCMEKYWKITEYGFISTSEFEELRTDSTVTFLILTQTRFEKDKGLVYYNFVNLLMGKDVDKIEEMPEFGSFPLSYSEVDEDKFVYKLPLIVQFFQSHVKNIQDNPGVTALQYLNHYNENASRIKDKVLMLAEDDLGPKVKTMSGIKALYSGEFEIVSHEEMEKAIDERRTNSVILHKVGPEGSKKTGRSYKVIIGCYDGLVYYSNYHNISPKRPDGFLESDFKRLSRFK